MLFELTQLRTRITRRTAILLLCCGLVPAMAIAAVGYRAVSTALVHSASDHLVQESKVYAGRVSNRLQELAQMLRGPIDSISLGHGRPGHSSAEPDPRAHFDAVVLESGPDRVTRSLGVMPARPTLSDSQEDQLRRGLSVLVMNEATRLKSFFVVSPLGKPGSEYPRTWGHAWVPVVLEDLEPPAPGKEWCVYSDSLPIYCRAGSDSVRLTRGMQLASGTLRWRDGDAAFLSGYFRVVLRNIAGAAPWVIALNDREANALTPLAPMRNIILFGSLVTTLALTLLARVLARGRVKPLVGLTAAAEQLRSGDLSARVDPTSNPEFEGLTDAFNVMASELDRQFSTLEALQRVDLATLEERTVASVSGTVSQGIPTLLRASAVAVVAAHRDDPLRWCGEVVGADRPAPVRIDVMVTRSVFAALRTTPDWFVVAAGDPLPDYCAALRPEPGASVVIFPMMKFGRPFGVLAAVLRAGAAPQPRMLASGRQIASQLALGLTNAARLDDLESLSGGAMIALARAIDSASPWTAGHSERVADIAAKIASRVGLDERSQMLVRRGALAHDIGKLAVPHAILNKPGQLTDDELCTIETHPVLGAEMILSLPVFREIMPLVQHHHELLDGSGYPHGLRAEKIPPMVRVLTVADVYDALISDRPYREGMSPEGALGILRRDAGVKFDERVVTALEAIIREDAPQREPGSAEPVEFGNAEITALLADVQQLG